MPPVEELLHATHKHPLIEYVVFYIILLYKVIILHFVIIVD